MADLGAPEFMEVNWEQQEKDDEAALQSLLADTQRPGQEGLLFDDKRPLDTGEKADDAQDFEDISDDDLPDEEEATNGKDDEAPGLTDDVDMGLDDDDDDLFGDNQASTPYDHFEDDGMFPRDAELDPHTDDAMALQSVEPVDEVEDLRALNFPGHGTIVQDDTPADYEGDDEFVKQNWPHFDPESATNNLNELLPVRYAHFIPKVPVKPPKQVNPTKVSLDLAGDQEKNYRAAGVARFDKAKWIIEAESKGLVPIVEESSTEDESENEFDFAPLDREARVGGLSTLDIEIACADWESMIDREVPAPPVAVEEEPMDDWEREFLGHSAKRKRVQEDEFVIGPIYPTPSFDNFEHMAAQVAKRVQIDMNDPHLLVDVQDPQPVAKRRRVGMNGKFKGAGNGNLGRTLSARFNMSNDDAYDALKQNHQSKVRATLGNISVEHSLPAQKLQWPYYLVSLDPRFIRSHHRPSFTVLPRTMNTPISFSKPGLRKKKTVKNMSTTELFNSTKDLSLSEHYSSATLLEYSEEYPTLLSNFGMGNRIINYYRRKDANDQERPAPEDKVGDVTVLLPEDKSPFANFGFVDPGETVRAIHNQMYRAPIFKHESQSTDFLVIRTQSGIGGASWHIRNIDNVFAVGQQFPSVDIPGPHSRKVTNAQKSRMKMIAYRRIRHSKDQHLKIAEITRHIPNSVDMQNRQKLKEFMIYDKVEKVWRLKPGDVMPDEAAIRSMVKPEDICLIDAMQVGLKQLEDAGYQQEDKETETLNEGEGTIEQQLAPWNTSKAFLDASADKAMLKLHGEGDPTGRGSGFSLIKTSMKGGYLDAIQHGPMSSAAARVAKDPKANNGHTYNVKAQQALYNNSIRRIWEQQKSELSTQQLPELTPTDMERLEQRDDEMDVTPANFDDDNASVMSHNRPGRVLRITRMKKGTSEPETITIRDEKVIKKYVAIRQEQQKALINATTWHPTGNSELDELGKEKAEEELKRLKKNKERREHRENVKANGPKVKKGKAALVENGDAASPSATPGPGPSTEKSGGTTRKCANCGQIGHIKTNKKYCESCRALSKKEMQALGKLTRSESQ